MKAKAQLAIEFIFVFLYFLILISALFTISDYFIENQVKIHIKNQETKIANSVSKILTASNAFNEANEYSLEYRIPMIHIFGKLIEMPCEITVTPNNIRIRLIYKSETIEKNLAFNSNHNLSTKCGELLKIEKP